MNRLTFKQRGLICAVQSAEQRARRARNVCFPCEPTLLNTRKAFVSDRTLDQLSSAADRNSKLHAQANPRALLTEQGFMMHLTVSVADVTELRRRIIGTCGDLVLFMRIQPLHHASKMRIWILLKRQEFDFVRRVIQSSIPDAEFVDVE